MDKKEYEKQRERLSDYVHISGSINTINQILEDLQSYDVISFQSFQQLSYKTIDLSDEMKRDMVRMLEKRKVSLHNQLEEV